MKLKASLKNPEELSSKKSDERKIQQQSSCNISENNQSSKGVVSVQKTPKFFTSIIYQVTDLKPKSKKKSMNEKRNIIAWVTILEVHNMARRKNNKLRQKKSKKIPQNPIKGIMPKTRITRD